jgi:glyoxylase-like metal-dependent hydrolase (beta-lactamase superfamily II)
VKIVKVPNGVFAENSYVVIDEQTRLCVVVDPGEEPGLILHKIEESDAQPVAIWLTHAHVDHILGVPGIVARTGASVWLHPADRPLYDAVREQAAGFGLVLTEGMPAPALPRDLVAGQQLKVGDLSFDVRHAPGHSPGSVCLVGHGVVFSGDVLFAGSIGRTDLPGGDFETLIASIERELLPLPDDTIVYSGHGPETTIGRERQTNPFLTGVNRIV